MPRTSQPKKGERERNIQSAINHYKNSDEASIRASAERFGVAYSTLRGRLTGVQDRVGGHRGLQALTKYEEKSIVRWCGRLDEWGHPPTLAIVRAMAQGIVQRPEKERRLGKHWLGRFLGRHQELASRLCNRLDRQRAFASNPRVLQDFFKKVCILLL